MSIQIRSKLDSTNPYHIYYDLDMINNDSQGNNAPQILRFTEIRNSPYLMAPENYFMSVIRFSLHTPSLPVFIPIIQTGQPDSNLTIYSFTMTYNVLGNDIVYRQFVNYVPSSSSPLPPPPLVKQEFNSDYYYVFSYQHWIECLNIALTSCFNGLNALVVAAGGVLPTANAPFIEFDPYNDTCILNADILGFNKSLANPIKLYFNNPMNHILTGFQNYSYGYLNVLNGKNHLIDIYSINDSNIINLPSGNYLQMYQEGSSIAMLNPIQSIVFTTALLPVNPSIVSVPKVFGQNTTLLTSGDNNNLSPVLTDFEVAFEPNNTYRPIIHYSPQSEYRFTDLYGSSPISAIELTVFWKDNFGVLHPFYLNSGCSGNVKLLFRRKDFNNITL